MKRYETYKDSGIQWWEEIPTHWDLKKAKHIFSLVTENVSDSSLPKIALENIESWTGKYIETDSDFMGEGVEFKKDDILFGKLRPYLAKVYKAEFAGQAVGDIYVFRGNEEQNPEYLKYLLLSYPFISVVDGSTYGAKMPRANWDFISHLVLPCPPKTEQVTIAAFLDHKVGQIDATIAEKEQMLKDLKNYRSAIISEAVTKGLDKNVEMKDSGIEWCGYIPIHWQVLKIGYIFQNLDYLRQPISSENRERNNPQYEYYGASGVIDKIDSYNVNDKVLLIGEDGANLVSRTLPLIYKAEGKFWVNNHAHILKPISSDYDYMAFLLETADYTNYITGSAQPKLSQEKLSSVKLPVPPIEEQKQIAKKLICIVPLIDRSLIEIEKIIKDLKSYKSALITEVVTGKIDLREWKSKEEND